jgi:Mannitol repressor
VDCASLRAPNTRLRSQGADRTSLARFAVAKDSKLTASNAIVSDSCRYHERRPPTQHQTFSWRLTWFSRIGSKDSCASIVFLPANRGREPIPNVAAIFFRYLGIEQAHNRATIGAQNCDHSLDQKRRNTVSSDQPANPPNLGANLSISNRDTPVSIKCVRCNSERIFVYRQLIQGVEYICDRCGVQISTSGGTAQPTGTVILSRGEETLPLQVIQRSDGFWIFLNDGERSILSVLDNDSERAVAIVVGSMIENRLERALLAKFRRDKKIEERMFQPSGPLGPFSVKIDLAFLIGMITPEAHKDLLIVKNIRNAFAHNLGIQNFRSQSIADNARNLKMIDTWIEESKPGDDGIPRFGAAIDPTAQPPVLQATNLEMRKKSAKERFLLTAQLMTIRFAACEMPSCGWPLI